MGIYALTCALKIDFHKTTFDNTFNAKIVLQEQAPWFPAEGKETVHEWLKTYKKVREAFKESVNESYKQVEEFVGNIEKTAAKTKAGK